MATYREIVYMVLDELKLISDDSHFVEEHVLFLADKYRSFILKQRYSDIRKEIPISNYQVICIDLEKVNLPSGDICGAGTYLKSTKPIPNILPLTKPEVSPIDLFGGNFNYVNALRFKYTGKNKYLKNQVYTTIAPDHYLYMKSNNSQLYYLQKVKLTGIFEDSSQLLDFQCPDANGETACDVMDMTYPLEESLIPVVIELIVKELSAFKYQAKDDINNANDDLSDLAAYIRQQLANGKRSDLYKDHS
jgi:hypothetical protein